MHKKKRHRGGELKGSKTSWEVKKYFYGKAASLDFKIYAFTLNKKRVNQNLVNVKDRLYNYLARLVLDEIDFNQAHQRVMLILDKSKSKPEIVDFNRYIFQQIKARLDPKVPLDIMHRLSHEMPGLQAVDLFAWGIFRKYEKRDAAWFEIFREKVAFDEVYLP